MAVVSLLSASKLNRDEGPLYRQIAALLREAIMRGEVAVGACLPHEAQLAEECGVSLITVRHALRDLETVGLIRKRAAKAALVIANTPRRPSWEMNSFADIVTHTREARLDIVSWKPELSPRAAQVFGLPETERCPCLRARLVVGGLPEAEITIYFPPVIGNRLRREDFDDVVVFRSVQRRLGLSYAGARVTVRAELADARLARMLECRPGSAVLAEEQVYFAPDREPLELTIARHRADLYSVSYDLRPDPDG